MRRKAFLAVVLAACVGLLAAGAVASSAIFSTQTAKANVITVVAGKPGELAFQLSKSTKLKVGTYIFKVTNKGLGFHTFKFCSGSGEDRREELVRGQGDEDSESGTVGVVHRHDQEGRQV